MERNPCVYIMTNKPDGTLYTGVTSNLPHRAYQHKHHFLDGFTDKYNLEMLVWYEQHTSMVNAIEREKELKKWKRQWKVALIEEMNPLWEDLYSKII